MDELTDRLRRTFGTGLSPYTLLGAVVLSLAMACDGGGACGGCDAFSQQDFPERHYDKTVKQAGQVRLTESGITFLENEVGNLLTQFRPQGLDFCIPKSNSGDITVCTDSTCANGQPGCQLNLSLNDAKITPKPSDTLLIEAVIGDIVEKIPFEYDLTLYTASCTLNLHKDGADTDVPAEVGVGLPLKFVIDMVSKLNNMTVKLGDPSIDLSDLAFEIEGSIDCEAANLVKGLFEGQIEDQLRNQLIGTIQEQVTSQFCQQCGSNQPDCPSNASCGSENNVDVCKWDANDECVSSPLGVEGRLKLSSALGDFMEPSEAKVDTIARAADLAEVDTGLNIGLRTGFQQNSTHPCAPVDPETRPTFDDIQKSSKILTDTKPGGDSFMVGLGLHKRAVEHVLWSTWASGGTCLKIGAGFNDLLTTDALRLFIKSLENLTSTSQPLYLRVSPQTAPKVELGNNEIQETEDGYELQDPLMTINWTDLDLHFYGFIQDRYTRLYTTRMDLEIPIGLEPNGMGQIVPVVGDLENAYKNIRIRNQRLLQEDKEKLKSVVPMLLSQALPRLTGSLADPIDLPEFSGYQLVLEKGDITSVDNNKFIALYTDLKRASNMQPIEAEMSPRIEDLRVHNPPVVEGEVPEPLVSVDLRTDRGSGFRTEEIEDVEYSYRVDNGLWSMFERKSTLEIRHPALALEGEHRIQIRARSVGFPGTATEPIERTVRIDYQKPEIDFDRDGRTVSFEGEDVVDTADELEYRYRAVGEDGDVLRDWTAWGDAAEIDLVRLGTEQPVELTVEARDRAGHVGSATETFPTTPSILGSDDPDAPSRSGETPETGCSTGAPTTPPVGGWLLLALGALGLLIRRRSSRWTGLVALIALTGLLLGGCNDISSGEQQKCDPSCEAWQTCQEGECVGKSCSSDAECSCPGDEPGVCLDGSCTCKDFCPDGCGEDQFCCYAENSCQSYPDPCSDTSCDPGFQTKVVSNGTADQKSCEVSGAQCDCVELEPLRHGWYGKHASIDSRAGTTAVSAYNRTYGDLMVGVVEDDLAVNWTYVDGVPSDGEVVAAPSGPRGGIEAPGDDVGTHSAIAVDESGTIHVFYRDEDEEALKYARGTSSSGTYEFSTTTIREEQGEGLYTSAAIRDGVVHAVYGTDGVEITVGGNPVDGSQLRHISFPVDTDLGMLSPDPETLDSAGTRNPCDSCAMSDRCFLESTTCKEPTGDCDGCESGQSCLNGSCKSIYLPSENLPHRLMTGLYTEIVPRSDDLVVVYYDHVDQRVGWVTGETGNWSDPSYAGSPTGPYVSAAADSNGALHMSFMDPETQSLLYRAPNGDSTEQIVDGVRSSNAEHLMSAVGENVDLWLDSEGNPHVTYQDATRHELFRADRRSASNWSAWKLTGPGPSDSYQGARGFYSANAQPRDNVAVEMVIDQQVEPVEAHLEFSRLE